jgi:hypothetical protein
MGARLARRSFERRKPVVVETSRSSSNRLINALLSSSTLPQR